MTDDMKILLIGIVSIFVLIVLVYMLISFKEDLKKLDESNKQFINEDGDHLYYDRKLIKEKRKEKKDNK